MRHLWETTSGPGDSGTGTKPTPCHIHTHPTTSHTPHAQQAPRPRPRLFCPHSPICTQPTGTPRCPAPTRRPDLASAPLMRSKRRPPRPKHSKFTQFHRSGLHFGRTHPQHRQCGNSSKVYGDCHSVRGRRSLARHRKRRTERRSQRGRRAGGPPPTGTGTPSSPTQRLPETTTTRKPQCLPRPQRPRRALRAGPGRGSG